MSDPVLAEKDPAVVLAAALEVYRQQTGDTLAPADPRRLHLQALLLLLAQQRTLIDFSGKQSLLRFVSDQWIDELASLWGETRLPAEPSTCTVRFSFATSAAWTIPAGVRVTDGKNFWSVTTETSNTSNAVDAPVECTVAGGATNGVAPGQIVTLVDPDLVPFCTGVSNTTETVSGRDIEDLEAFRTRLRSAPESRSTCGPRNAYEAAALEASATVADVVAIGPDDSDLAGSTPAPGEVVVLIIEGTRDASGVLTSTVPDPSGGLITTVTDALTAEDVRPLTDSVTVRAPSFVLYDLDVTYYISRSRSASAVEIQVAVEAAFDAFKLWQSRIGRDINPSELIARLVNAGAKRAVVTQPAFTALKTDECSKLEYETLTYAGVEDD